MQRIFLLSALIYPAALLMVCETLSAQDQRVRFHGSESAFVMEGTFNPAVPSPEEYLGRPIGEQPVRHAQVLEYFRLLEKTSDRVRVSTMGQTYEGRELIHAVITDAGRLSRLEEVKADIRKIADPRTVAGSTLEGLLDITPAVAWMAYSIHGDETSGVDASMAVAYHLAAGTDAATAELLKNLIVIVDPIENPDGRERFIAQMQSFASAVPHADGQSFQKGGFWPWGRGNHYLFDMNRDWFSQELPESKARIVAINEWHPQLLVDAHEMGQWDSYLFNPPRHPFIPQLGEHTMRWWNRFAADQASAFDRRGWAYYTREWNEEWYPGYGSSWPLLTGAVGILYEQAGVSGSRVSRHDGTVLTYAESVEHHYVSSMANLATAGKNRRSLLSDYHSYRSRAIETHGGGRVRSYLIRPDANPDRLNHLAATLIRQGIDVRRATGTFSASARGYYSDETSTESFPDGTLIVPMNQPQGFLAQAILSFDTRIPDSFLVEERRELLKNRSTRLYEITSWSLLQAYGLDAFAAEGSISTASEVWVEKTAEGGLIGSSPLQGFVFETGSDRALRAVSQLLQRDVKLFAADKELDWEGKKFSRGSVFVPRRSNHENYEQILGEVARKTGLAIYAVNSGLGRIGPDLGGGELQILRRPSIALIAGGGTSPDNVGWIWQLLDQKLSYPVALLDVSQLSYSDLGIYNTLILPSGWTYPGTIGKPAIERIKTWIENGGTLIAMGSGAEFCADSSVGLSSVRLRSQVILSIAEYEQAARDARSAEEPSLDGLQIWERKPPEAIDKKTDEEKPKPDEKEIRRVDELGELFSPRGAILRVELDQEEWLTYGLGTAVPVMVRSSSIYVSKHPPVRTAGRFAKAEDLRVSGLLWPEARARIADSAFLTRERSGQGQVILFSDPPNFRSFFRGSERLLSNALLFGPGLGTSWTPDWQ